MKQHNTPYFRLLLTVISLLLYIAIKAQAVEIHLDNRDDYTKLATAQYSEGNWEEGKKIVDKGLSKYPHDSDLKMLSGRYYYEKKDYDKARYELKKALDINPENVDAKQILINVETESKRYSSAICYVNELLEVTPYWKGLWRKKIELYELQNNTVEANRLRKRISQIFPEDAQLQKDYLYQTEVEVAAKSKAGKIDEAIELNKELIKNEANNPNHYISLANNYIKAGDTKNALITIERGLNTFPANYELANKKIGILADEKRFGELLAFIQYKMQRGFHSDVLRKQYDYYLLEAARYAKNQDAATLYYKIFDQNPSNEEAFSYVFNAAIGNLQYEEALSILNRHQKAVGDSKFITQKRLLVYNRMGDTNRANALIKELFSKYPDDVEIRESYVKVLLDEAKSKVGEEKYTEAIANWNIVKEYGDDEAYKIAQSGIYNAYMSMKDYPNALNALNILMEGEVDKSRFFAQKADIYQKQGRYNMAVSAYTQAIASANEEQKNKYIDGYSEMLTDIVKELNSQYRYEEAMNYVSKWLDHDPHNYQALLYAVNISSQLKDTAHVKSYATIGNDIYPDDIFFKLKLAEIKGLSSENYGEVYEAMHNEVLKTPYHKSVVNAFLQLSEDYGKYLIRNQQSGYAITVLDTALRYEPQNKTLKYMKGLALEKLNRYDSAYYYQSFYEASLLEYVDFKRHLNYLKYKSYRNEIGMSHLINRFGDDYKITHVTSIEYNRFTKRNTYTGRLNYSGRAPGHGVQLQVEWQHQWQADLRSKINIAGANKFFPLVVTNFSLYKDFKIWKLMEFEFGLGYRLLSSTQHLPNLVLGATKEWDNARLNLRFNNFLLNSRWLFNVNLNARYYFNSPKSYIMATAGTGTSPDVDLINYQLYNGFSVLNTMAGIGGGFLIIRNVTGGVMGNWYHYRASNSGYRSLYTLFLNLNVAF